MSLQPFGYACIKNNGTGFCYAVLSLIGFWGCDKLITLDCCGTLCYCSGITDCAASCSLPFLWHWMDEQEIWLFSFFCLSESPAWIENRVSLSRCLVNGLIGVQRETWNWMVCVLLTALYPKLVTSRMACWNIYRKNVLSHHYFCILAVLKTGC